MSPSGQLDAVDGLRALLTIMTAPLRLFNSLTRELETFRPINPGEARVYTCGPTVYNYPHIGKMRAYGLGPSR